MKEKRYNMSGPPLTLVIVLIPAAKSIETRLTERLSPAKPSSEKRNKYGEKRLVKGTDEYEQRRQELDDELDQYMKEETSSLPYLDRKLLEFVESLKADNAALKNKIAAMEAEKEKIKAEQEEKKEGEKKVRRPVRPLSAYMRYVRYRRPRIAAVCPDAKDIPHLISNEWNRMSDNAPVKMHFRQLEKQDRERGRIM